MDLDPAIYRRIVAHAVRIIAQTALETEPFPHVLLAGVFPADVYEMLVQSFPSSERLKEANPKYHRDAYGLSTRQHMLLCEDKLRCLPPSEHGLWTTVRAALGSRPIRDAIFSKLAKGLVKRFGVRPDQVPEIRAFPRTVFYSENEGYKIAPHPDTREKIVTMQFAFASDESLRHVGTEFYTPSLNPLHLLREPRGFVVARTMPFLPNHAYAFTVLNAIGLKSWHGRSTIASMGQARKSLLHVWYSDTHETDCELDAYEEFLRTLEQPRMTA